MPGRSFSRFFGTLRKQTEHNKITMKEASVLWKKLTTSEQEQYPPLPRKKRKIKDKNDKKKKPRKKRGVNGYIIYNVEHSSNVYHTFEKSIAAPTLKIENPSESQLKSFKSEITNWRRSIMKATSQTISQRWKNESPEVKAKYKQLALERNLKAKNMEEEKANAQSSA